MHSAIYTGKVRHRRFKPTEHEFIYRVFMVYLDLDEVAEVFSLSRLWSATGPALIRFNPNDFFGKTDKTLKASIQDWIFEQTGKRLNGPVRLLANFRFAGFIINPICCYYCFSDDGEKLEYVVAEVTNTPWKERTRYLLPCASMDKKHGQQASGEFGKEMHVSPFHPMEMRYQWRLDRPAANLNLHFDNLQQGEKVFDASLMLGREALTATNMRAIVWRFPFMTLRVALAIHWQALKLWLKKTPLYPHPDRNKKHQHKAA